MADVSLDEIFLEAAGRAKSGGWGKKMQAPTDDWSSRDRIDSNQDYDEFGEGGGGPAGSMRKAKTSKMPLKTMFESLDKDKDNHGDGYKSEFSYGSDLYKYDEDRDRLAAMIELEQEMELVRGETRYTTGFKKESGGTAANREFKAKGKRRASRSRSSFLHALISQRVCEK